MLPVGSILKPFRGGLGGEVPGLDALARLACGRNLLLPTSSSGESSFLPLEPRPARSFAMFSLAWCSWFLRFETSRSARARSFFSLANCGSKPSDLSVQPLLLPNGALLLVSAWASIARSCRMPSSSKRPTGAPLILQNFSQHVENTFLRFSVDTSSPGLDLKTVRAQIQ